MPRQATPLQTPHPFPAAQRNGRHVDRRSNVISSLKGPRGHWLLGNLREFRAGMLLFFEKYRDEFGAMSEFRLGRRHIILLSEPSLIEEVLVTQNRIFRKHFGVQLLKPVLGNGLLLSEGPFWLRQRRMMQPAFSRQLSAGFAGIVLHHACRLSQDWQAQPHRDLYRDMTAFTAQVAAEALLGVEMSSDMRAITEALEEIHADFEFRFQQIFNFPMWIPTQSNRRLRGAVMKLTAVIDRMISIRRRTGANGHDALALLIRAGDETGQRMSNQQLRDEVMTLLLAGHDTTANAITWSWYLLSQHPQEAAKLQRETLAVLQGRSPTSSDLGSLRCCRNVLLESMRLYPPAYMIGREAVCDCTVGGIKVRKGTSILLCQWLVHRDPRYFDRPLEFLPDRWNENFERRLPPYAYFPFGGGPRVCIGKELALLEGALVLAVLGSRFNIRLEQPQEVRPWPTVTLRPAKGVEAKVTSSVAMDSGECIAKEVVNDEDRTDATRSCRAVT